MTIMAQPGTGITIRSNGASLLDKGMPFAFDFEDALASRLNVLDEALHFPLLVLKQSALTYNLAAMADWCQANQFLIAPHGKTTMAPRIFERQIQAGAWAITVATVSQAAICAEMGIERIFIANQVVGRANIRSVAAMMKAHPALDLLCLVDSIAGIEFLQAEWQAAGVGRPLGVLVEMGHPGWRTGARSQLSALALCTQVLKYPGTLRLRGVEGFEGSAHAPDHRQEGKLAREFLRSVATFASQAKHLFPEQGERPLLSIGGSSFLDAVLEIGLEMQGQFQILIRSGCYVTHDHGFCEEKLAAAHLRAGRNHALPSFRPALELWSQVQSKPEQQFALLNFGKRDCSYDLGLPAPLFARQARSREKRVDLEDAAVVSCNDQHAHLKGRGAEPLEVGDLVCCGLSHPCTAFDKWRAIPVVDDHYHLLDIYRTYF